MPDPARIDWDVRIFSCLASTNVALREMAAEGAPEGLTIVADEQTAGRGRHGRSWNSPAGAGFYGSFLFRPRLAAREVQTLTFVAAVAVAESLDALGAPEVAIKWPNDVLARGRKVSGILTEASLVETRVEWAVVGIGVNLTSAAIPPDLVDRATSLEAEGVRATNLDLLGRLLERLSVWYVAGPSATLARWRELAPMSDAAPVTVDDGREAYEATTDGVTDDGLLRVRRADGHVAELSAAEVTLRSRQ